MKFTIARTVFLEGVQKTLGIVEKKTTMPILANVLIQAETGSIRIVATDREIGLVSTYPAEVTEEGATTLSARKLYEMLRESAGETVHFETSEQHQTVLTAQKAVYRIPGIPAEEYPQVIAETEAPLCPLPAAILREMISRTFFAVSTDEMRRNLNGVLWKTNRGEQGMQFEMVATDGHRLALAYSEPLQAYFPEIDKGIIIPRKGLGEIRKLLEGSMGDVSVAVEHGMLVLKTDSIVLRVSLIDGEYPDYRRVIPNEAGKVVSFPREVVLHALRRMNVVSSEGYNGVIVTLSADKMVLHSTNPDVGEANDEIDVQYTGEEFRVGYNVNYLIDAIEAVEEDRIEFEVGVGMKPGVIRPANSERYLCIVMPLRI